MSRTLFCAVHASLMRLARSGPMRRLSRSLPENWSMTSNVWFAELLDDPVGKRFANAFDQAAAEYFLNADDGARNTNRMFRRRIASELFVCHPPAVRPERLAHVQGRQIPDDGDRLAPSRGGRRSCATCNDSPRWNRGCARRCRR